MSAFTKEQLTTHITAKLARISNSTVPVAMVEQWDVNKRVLEIALAALTSEAQEPVGIVRYVDMPGGRTGIHVSLYVNNLPEGTELYAGPQPVAVPDGWKLVPVEPTEHMIVNGFESEPDETFSDPVVWEEYQAMSGCQQAAHRAKLCWAAMLAAVPQEHK